MPLYHNHHKISLETRYTIGSNSSVMANSKAQELLVSNSPLKKWNFAPL